MKLGMHTELRGFLEWIDGYDVNRGKRRLLDEIECVIAEAEAGEIEAQPDVAEIAELAVAPILRHLESWYSEDVLQVEFAEARKAGWHRAPTYPSSLLQVIYRKPSLWRRSIGLSPNIAQAKIEADRFARESLLLDQAIVLLSSRVVTTFLYDDPEIRQLSKQLCAALGRPQSLSGAVASRIPSEVCKGHLRLILEPFLARKREISRRTDAKPDVAA